MIIVYGADWCEDTRRSLRHLRRLGVPHLYVNIDEDLDALYRAMALNGGNRRTPTVDLGLGRDAARRAGQRLADRRADRNRQALAGRARDRLDSQNVGDFERVLRTTAGATVWLAAQLAPRPARWPLRLAGAALVVSGVDWLVPRLSRGRRVFDSMARAIVQTKRTAPTG